MANQADWELMQYVRAQIRTGTKHLVIPAELMEFTSQEGRQEARALCKLRGVKINTVTTGC